MRKHVVAGVAVVVLAAGCGDDDEAEDEFATRAAEAAHSVCTLFSVDQLARALDTEPTADAVSRGVGLRAVLASYALLQGEFITGEVERPEQDRRELVTAAAAGCRFGIQRIRAIYREQSRSP
jgi:hypothetical protein